MNTTPRKQPHAPHCRVCGCCDDADDKCISQTGMPCWWADESQSICSQCQLSGPMPWIPRDPIGWWLAVIEAQAYYDGERRRFLAEVKKHPGRKILLTDADLVDAMPDGAEFAQALMYDQLLERGARLGYVPIPAFAAVKVVTAGKGGAR